MKEKNTKMPSVVDYIANKFRTLKRGGSMRSRRPPTLQHSAIGGPSTSTEASAPSMTPFMQMPQLVRAKEDDPPKYGTIQRNTLQRSSTLGRNSTLSTGATTLDPNRNFWDIKGYRNTLHRCEDGFTLANKLADCLKDRARIEDEYSRSLKQWNKKWTDYLVASQSEYGTSADAWLGMLQTGEDIATIHSDLSEKIQQSPVSSIKAWVKERYQKSALKNFKQVKEFEADFETAQKSWQKMFEKMKQRKKEYYVYCQKERSALTKSETIRSNIDKTEDQKKKVVQEHELAKYETDRAKKSYIDEVQKLSMYRDTYEKAMKDVFRKTDDFEEVRKRKFEEILRDAHRLFEEQVYSDQYKATLNNFMETLNHINHKHDIQCWEKMYGAGMEFVQPEFEEYFSEK